MDDTEALKGAMLLIHSLVSAGIHTIVGFCSSDIILWKTAGANSCATGKFFNLRKGAGNFSLAEMKKAGQLADKHNKKLYVKTKKCFVLDPATGKTLDVLTRVTRYK